MTRIKICGITRSEDALVCAQAGVDAIGLVFYPPSPRHVAAAQAAAITRALPPFITTVGLFVNPAPEQVEAVLNEVRLDVLQFHGDESPEFCAGFGVPYLKAIRVKAGVDLVQCAIRYQEAQGLLLDAYVEGTPGGTGQFFDWELIPAELPLPVVLSGGLSPANIAEAIRRVRPWAVDVSSGVEASKGIKDAAKIAAFIEEARKECK
ncbi:MAG: N-(5'-phosphoribosyl)anthranilate isomerase [Betaproteobacteria bacterium CG2_30_59_46]|nr:MAG: N-(5'-phosphoribosyl)anthranilate isomerase [Betaproteobacteria bacterium CG2_30_59_46]PIQ12610.1 MAG: phosphoribosylanthranilate isomerase [Hydrogenophilales bacterium CG18_big_fil_WC_8_21_14_2_50_58_12]PIY00253.1 MAG: phosphoribosylanthranilate isomerase [Hydrogenophilales bacterium CG_4_10_14_3_um_filter_58_23]PJB03523.1 MAG: phosphoribosylanthranilate isomerase [Hydrogenophilales bacterium CG_4_9_14_3_um_filter_59_35]